MINNTSFADQLGLKSSIASIIMPSGIGTKFVEIESIFPDYALGWDISDENPDGNMIWSHLSSKDFWVNLN